MTNLCIINILLKNKIIKLNKYFFFMFIILYNYFDTLNILLSFDIVRIYFN